MGKHRNEAGDRREEGRPSPSSEIDVEQLVADLKPLARELQQLHKQMRALGLFPGDRPLMSCPQCGLMEDVLIDGRLITDREGSLGQDTGLRFIEDEKGDETFLCPECGCAAVADDEEYPE